MLNIFVKIFVKIKFDFFMMVNAKAEVIANSNHSTLVNEIISAYRRRGLWCLPGRSERQNSQFKKLNSNDRVCRMSHITFWLSTFRKL